MLPFTNILLVVTAFISTSARGMGGHSPSWLALRMRGELCHSLGGHTQIHPCRGRNSFESCWKPPRKLGRSAHSKSGTRGVRIYALCQTSLWVRKYATWLRPGILNLPGTRLRSCGLCATVGNRHRIVEACDGCRSHCGGGGLKNGLILLRVGPL